MESRTLIAHSFMDGLAKLTVDEQALAKQVAFDLQHRPDHPGFQLHRLEGPDPNMWSARVNRDLRIIVNRHDGNAVLCFVAHHDEAYAWARRRRLETHETTGAAQFVVIDERVVEVIKRITSVQTDPAENDPGSQQPFRNLDDSTLLGYGVPRNWLDVVREASVDTFLSVIGDDLPAEAQENLLAVANGETPEPAPKPAVRDPFAHPDAKRRFHVIGDDDGAVRQALAAPWEAWQLFLHPSQRDAVERNYNGPARISGGPGTGKTVVAVHRAARLSQQGEGTVLLTTFSKTLAARLSQQVDLLVGADTPARQRIDVVHLHHRAVELWRTRTGEAPRIPSSADVEAIIARVAGEFSDLPVDLAFLVAEWTMVIEPLGIHDLSSYVRSDRTSRGTPLARNLRTRIWPVFVGVREALMRERFWTWSDICWDLTLELDDAAERPYRHAVADEVQDFGPAELRLLRALTEEGPNDVFLAGDAHQRIYKPRTSFARAGLEVRGRASVLRLNYRTTEQIRRAADRLVARTPIDEDGITDANGVSILSGPEPMIRTLPGVPHEIDTVEAWLRELVSTGYRPSEIGVFARTKRLAEDRGQRAIKAANLPCVDLERDEADANGVALGTIHRAKGLQFRAVAVIGVDSDTLPLVSVARRQADLAARRSFEEQERNLLYVACTRSRERLLVTSAREPSPFLAVLMRRSQPQSSQPGPTSVPPSSR